MYQKGYFVQKNSKAALKHMEKSAELGHIAAITYIGNRYEKHPDYMESSLLCYRAAAENLNADETQSLGYMYGRKAMIPSQLTRLLNETEGFLREKGKWDDSREKCDELAMYWYRLANHLLPNECSMNNIGNLLRQNKGERDTEDHLKATYWLTKAILYAKVGNNEEILGLSQRNLNKIGRSPFVQVLYTAFHEYTRGNYETGKLKYEEAIRYIDVRKDHITTFISEEGINSTHWKALLLQSLVNNTESELKATAQDAKTNHPALLLRNCCSGNVSPAVSSSSSSRTTLDV